MQLPVLQSSRCLLRPWTEDDADALHGLWTEPAVRRYLWDDRIIDRECVLDVLRSMRTAEADGLGGWSAYLRSHPDDLAGFAGFRVIEGTPDIELLYGLSERYHGQGLATEISQTMLDYLWSSTAFTRVLARTDPPNRKSVAVMIRLGMKHESTTDATVTYSAERPRLS